MRRPMPRGYSEDWRAGPPAIEVTPRLSGANDGRSSRRVRALGRDEVLLALAERKRLFECEPAQVWCLSM
jgi:hypothetical protein